jgi:ABC-type multidrug transport system ATPase subunit
MARLLGNMRDDGKTIFVVTHQPVVLEAVADESLLLSAGLLAARERGLPEYLKFPYSQRADRPVKDEDHPDKDLDTDKGGEGACPGSAEGGER